MKQSLLAAAAASLLFACGSALAADLPTKAPGYKAPYFGWGGCYVGTHNGVFIGRSNIDLTNFNNTSQKFDQSFDDTELATGGQVGCNYQTGAFVLGVEADISWVDFNKTSIIDTNNFDE